MVFHWSLSDSKFLQVSRPLLSILVNLNNVVVWIVSTHPFISTSSSSSTNPLVTVPSASFTIGITVTFMSHSFFSSLAKSCYLSFFSLSFSFILCSAETAKSTIRQVLSFYWSGRLAKIRWSICISDSQRILSVSFFTTNSVLYIFHLFVWSNLNFLPNSQWITYPAQLYPVLYSLGANLLHSLIMWLIVSSLSPHNLHLLFCCVKTLFPNQSNFWLLVYLPSPKWYQSNWNFANYIF